MSHYVVIGASHAGISFAERLRKQGCDDAITLIDRLEGVPLQRPPLSKAYLSSEDGNEADFYLRGADWFDLNQIELRDGVSVTSIDRAAKSISLSDGSSLGYDRLILALGAVPRRLPMPEMDAENVFVLRDGADAKALKAALPKAQKAVVIGGGYIGLEAAASMRKKGLEVHVIEAAPRLLARVASPQISQAYQTLHEDNGVTIHKGCGVSGLAVTDGAISGVQLGDGSNVWSEMSCDILLVGIGVLPEIALADAAGLEAGNGILTDYHYQTNDADIYAIGDNVLAEGRGDVRIESIHNAQYGAHYIAARFTDSALPQEEAPWFWSDQYDRKLQSAGLVPAPSEDVVQISRTGRKEGSLSVWSYHRGVLRSVESINDPQAYIIGKGCLEKGLSPAMDDIANPAFELKSLR